MLDGSVFGFLGCLGQTRNVSLYANGNPVVFVDPSGLTTLEAIVSLNLPSIPGVGEIGDSSAKPRGISVGVGFSFPFFDGGDFDLGFTGTASVGGGPSVGIGRLSFGITGSSGSLRDQRGTSINAGFNDGIGGVSAGIDENGNASIGVHLGPGYEVYVEQTETGVISARDGLESLYDGLKYLFGC